MARATTGQTQNKTDKVDETVTEVKPTETVTTTETKTQNETDKVEVFCEALKNKSVYGVSGLIEFDVNGKALVSVAEAEHFRKIPCYKVGE